MLVIAALAIVVIGPKQLPGALRTLGQWMAKARSIAREFQGSIDDMVRDSELTSIRDEVNSIASFDVKEELAKQFDPEASNNDLFDIDGDDPLGIETSDDENTDIKAAKVENADADADADPDPEVGADAEIGAVKETDSNKATPSEVIESPVVADSEIGDQSGGDGEPTDATKITAAS